ncbi:MAG: flavodoxin family protein, partial [Butyricicoccaceae bacterium]
MDGKKIVVLLGSGRRNGNTEQLADAFIRGARSAGHTVEKISLREKRVDGCLGCNACRRGVPCIQKDDFNEIAEKLRACDMIVFASPLLFWTLSARIKAVIERLYALAEPDPAPPLGRYEKNLQKDCALLMTAADDLFWTFEQAVSYYR